MSKNIQAQISRYCSYLHEWNASYEEYAKSVGLSYTGLTILGELSENENCTQKELAESCFLPKQTVNAIITSFLRNGWVKLEELPEDRRTKTVNFTNEGKAKATEILLKVRESERKAMQQLTVEQQEMLISLTHTYIGSCIEAMKNR